VTANRTPTISRAQKFLIGAGVLWLAASTQVGLLFLRDSIGELPVLLSSVAMIVLTPLVLIAFAWLWIRPQPPAPKVWITTLALPWIVAGLGLILGRTVHNLSRLIHDAEVDGACVQIDATVVSVLLSVESHKGLLDEGFLDSRAYLSGKLKRRPL